MLDLALDVFGAFGISTSGGSKRAHRRTARPQILVMLMERRAEAPQVRRQWTSVGL